jgi:hypothetical protein
MIDVYSDFTRSLEGSLSRGLSRGVKKGLMTRLVRDIRIW